MNDSVAPQSSELQRFRKIVARLRDPETGCPWDLKQNHDSLKKYFLEEVYEFLEEVDHANQEGMEEELGDVLLQIYLHAQLLEESSLGRINLETVARKISDKIIRRHPHVFEPDFDQKDYCPQTSWRDIKAKEKSSKSSSSLFENIGRYHPFKKLKKSTKRLRQLDLDSKALRILLVRWTKNCENFATVFWRKAPKDSAKNLRIFSWHFIQQPSSMGTHPKS